MAFDRESIIAGLERSTDCSRGNATTFAPIEAARRGSRPERILLWSWHFLTGNCRNRYPSHSNICAFDLLHHASDERRCNLWPLLPVRFRA
jgi:hypothetical protein